MSAKRILLAAAFLLPAVSLAADWKQQTAVQIGDEKEYPPLIELLQKEFGDMPGADKALASLLIGYCHSRMQNPQAELFWMKKYLEEFRAAKVDMGFIPPAARQRVQKFKLSWQKEFPVLWELALAPEQADIAFFDPPDHLKLRLQSSLPCDFQLLGRDGTLLAKGVLGAAVETAKLTLDADFFRTASHHFRLLLNPRGTPEKTIEKYFAIELEYGFPEEALFEPQTGELKLKGRDLQMEKVTETRVISRRIRFDKEILKKAVLKDLLIGAAFFVINATLITSTIDNPDTSLYAKSALFGTRRAFTMAGVGFSLSALVKLPKAFKREKIVEEKTRDVPEARQANAVLEQDLAQARRKVRVKLAVTSL